MEEQNKNERPIPFTPEPMEGMRCNWWMLCTKKQAANYVAQNEGHVVPGLGKSSIIAYPRAEALARGLDVSVVANPRDSRCRDSYGQKLYLIAHYVRATL